jgi:hypothetical protein
MRTRRLIVAPAVLAMACSLLLAAEPAALGKDNVTARLLTPLRLDAAAGEQFTVAWVLAGTDEHGQRQPFNAIGIFVRLRSASGGRPTVGFATPVAHPQGRYDAQVAVPEGGIGGIQIGLGDVGNVGVGETLFPLGTTPSPRQAAGWTGQFRRGWRWPAGWRCWACSGPWSGGRGRGRW